MISPKKIFDRIKEDMMYYTFKYGTFDLKEMQSINKSYAEVWNKITTQVIVWTAILSTNFMSLMYINTFLHVTFWQSIVAGIVASYIMKKGFDKYIRFAKSVRNPLPLKSGDKCQTKK